MIKVSVSNILDAPDVKFLKTSLHEYANIITESPLFDTNNNKDDINNLLYTFLEDLYIKEPEEVINFVNQKPSKKLIANLFSQFGISEKLLKAFPDLLKTKTAYMLSQLFETKGSNKTFDFFNEIISEFYHNLNFYNIRVEQREFSSKYEQPTIVNKYYLENDNSISNIYTEEQISDRNILKDDNIQVKIYTTLYKNQNKVKYHLKFYPIDDQVDISTGDWTLPYNVNIKLDYSEDIQVQRGETEIEVELKKYDIYDLSERLQSELVYKAEPILINDPLSVISPNEEINSNNFRTNKYLMQPQDYFNTNIYNTDPVNIFPIITNILYIQFGTTETIDAMEYHPDLVRMFAMTTTRDDVFSFKIGTTVVKVPMSEYVNILTFIKLKELQFKTRETGKEWKWGDQELVSKTFTSMIYPKDRINEIYELILYYKDMRHEHKTFNEFKRRFNLLMGDANQIKTSQIFNIAEFHEYLAGNIPETFDEFFQMLEKFYPNNVNFISSKDQNKILKEKVRFIYKTYSPNHPKELFNLIAMNDEEYIGLNSSLYDMLKLHFIDKYPRVVQQIEAIDSGEAFIELYLNNYKRMLVEVVKMDNLVTYFVNDTFKRFIMASTFKEEFFDPVMNLFSQYFFKAELSYQNTDVIIHTVKDKMQRVTCGTDSYYDVDLKDYYSELNIRDDMGLYHPLLNTSSVENDDSWNITIVNDSTGIHNFDESSDSGYKNGSKI